MLTNQTIDPNAPKRPFILWRPFIAAWHFLVPPSQAHADRQSGLARYAGAAVVTVVCLTAVTFAVIYAKPIQDAYQQWRATQLVQDARDMLDQGELFQAVLKAQEAYQIAPENIDAVRLNGEFFTRMGKPEGIYFLEKLQTLGAATPADLQLLARAYLNNDRKDEAQYLMEDIVSKNAATESTIKLAQDVFGDEVYISNMLPQLKQYVDSNPDDLRNRFRLAQLQLDSGVPSEVSKGTASLWDLADDNGKEGLEAIEFLAKFENLPPENTQRLIDRLRNHPRSTSTHGVMALRHKLRLHPEKRNEIIVEAISQYGQLSREELVPLVRWLVEEREFQQVLSLVSEEEAVKYQPLLENYLTSLTMLNRMEDLAALVNDRRVEMLLTPATQAFYKMHLAYISKAPAAELRELMEAALIRAEQEARSELVLAIANYGTQRGLTDVAEQAYLIASKARDPRFRIAGLEGYLKTSRGNGNTEGYLNAIVDAVRIWPDNQTYQEQFLYANLLLGRDIELSLDQAERLLKRQPTDSQRKLIVALAWWRLSHLSAATSNLQQIDISKLDPGQRAIVATIARSGNYLTESRQVLATIPADAQMLPEERQFLQSSRL